MVTPPPDFGQLPWYSHCIFDCGLDVTILHFVTRHTTCTHTHTHTRARARTHFTHVMHTYTRTHTIPFNSSPCPHEDLYRVGELGTCIHTRTPHKDAHTTQMHACMCMITLNTFTAPRFEVGLLIYDMIAV